MKERASSILQLAEEAMLFYGFSASSAPPAVEDGARKALRALKARLASVPWERGAINDAIKEVVKSSGLKMPQVAMPLRHIVTGRTQTLRSTPCSSCSAGRPCWHAWRNTWRATDEKAPVAVPAILALSHSGFAADLEPGEWEFTSTSTSRLFARAAERELQALHPQGGGGEPGQVDAQPDPQGDCKLTPAAKTADTYTWAMECPKAKMRGTGSARMSRATMEGETDMTGEVQGQKFELRTKVTGRSGSVRARD